jgi:hypothetical protein
MTEEYHRKRGSCCGNGCKHCAYEPTHKKGTYDFEKMNRFYYIKIKK